MILPEITPLTRPYWEGAQAGKLRLQHCLACANTWHPPSPACTACGALDFEWRDATGRGRVHSYIIVREALDPSLETRLPLVIALIRLDEGPLLISNILGCDPEQVSVEMPVEIDWEPLTAEIVLPQFRPL
jgi:uncharacterized OB-fold protein